MHQSHAFLFDPFNIERQIESNFNHMQHEFDRELEAMPKFPVNDTSLAKTGLHKIANNEFSDVDTTTECHEGVCLVRKCVNGQCHESE